MLIRDPGATGAIPLAAETAVGPEREVVRSVTVLLPLFAMARPTLPVPLK